MRLHLPPPPPAWELLANISARTTRSVRHDGLAHGTTTYYRVAGRTLSEICTYTEPLRVTTLDAEVALDINGEQGFNDQDALIMYYALTFPDVLGGTFSAQGYASMRDELLGPLTSQSTPTDSTLQGFLRTARQLVREHRDSVLDINSDGQIDAYDALIMYYAYSLPGLVGREDGEVANAIWHTFLAPLRGREYSTSNDLQPLLDQANTLNYK